MRKNWYLLAFMLGLSVTLGGAALFKRLGLPLPFSGVIQAQAAGLAPSAAAYTLDWFSVDGGGGTSSHHRLRFYLRRLGLNRLRRYIVGIHHAGVKDKLVVIMKYGGRQ